MERKTCERLILEKLEEIKEIYKEYNPNGDYLALSIVGGWISVNNEYYDKDAEKPINFYKGE